MRRRGGVRVRTAQIHSADQRSLPLSTQPNLHLPCRCPVNSGLQQTEPGVCFRVSGSKRRVNKKNGGRRRALLTSSVADADASENVSEDSSFSTLLVELSWIDCGYLAHERRVSKVFSLWVQLFQFCPATLAGELFESIRRDQPDTSKASEMLAKSTGAGGHPLSARISAQNTQRHKRARDFQVPTE